MTVATEPLPRRLTVVALWLLVINGLIGAGIFGVPATAARLTGAYSPLMFVLCGLLILPILLCFGELASYFRGTGGPIRYAAAAFGRFAGFETGWTFYIARMGAFAANLNLLVDSIAYFWAPANLGFTRVALMALTCGLITWGNVVGTEHAMRSLGGLTVLKFIPLVILVAVGLPHIDAAAFPSASAHVPSPDDIGSAALVMVYAYVGFAAAVVPAGEALRPAKDMPRALLAGLGVATLLYVGIQLVSLSVLPHLGESERPLLDVADVLLGGPGAALLMSGVVVSVGGNLMASSFSAARMSYVLAREGSLPEPFGRVHRRFETPHVSIVLYGVVAFVVASAGSFVWLAKTNVLVRVLMYMMCIGALPIVRRRFR
ncbi:MAG: APC family permease, partial [Myxococcota bacterium]